jgi:rsbT co-antagonist protein RsbR
MTPKHDAVRDLLTKRTDQVLDGWLRHLRTIAPTGLSGSTEETEQQARDLLLHIADALRANAGTDLQGEAWGAARGHLEDVSRIRVRQGYTSDQTALFVFSLKQPLFELLRRDLDQPQELAEAIWAATEFVDSLGLYTIRAFQRTREDVIARQQHELLELSTPVVKLWDGILALPMIGTLDSARTQIVMESLLRRIVDTGSEIAIIDITGVPTVDTLVAQHLLKTVTAIRLMGAECIISGVRPQIAQTIVHLGIDLEGVQTKATLADALSAALRQIGVEVARRPAGR